MITNTLETAGQLCDCGSGKVATDCCHKPKPSK